jgi:hypothetical protein
MRSIAIVILVVAVGTVAVFAWNRSGRGERVFQPIAFNHKVHLDEADLECLECHKDAATGVMAGLPGKEICLDCHDIDEEADSHPEKAKLVPYADGDQNIPWVRVALTRPDVFFSHRRHVTSGKLDCLRCHPDQPTLAAPPTYARLVMSMNDCLACHQERGANTDCLGCHR